MEVDHVFIAVKDPARAAEALVALGLVEGTANQHPGQGTANRRVFFRNAFIELLYLTDPQQAQSPLTAPTRLYERLSATAGGASPFGVCFRPSSAGAPSPMPGWVYRPAYLPGDLKVDVGHGPLGEPMWFFLGFAQRPDQAPAERAQPLEHAAGLRELTSVQVTGPGTAPWSPSAECATQVPGVTLEQGPEHLLRLQFDQGTRGLTWDLRPALPLVIHG